MQDDCNLRWPSKNKMSTTEIRGLSKKYPTFGREKYIT